MTKSALFLVNGNAGSGRIGVETFRKLLIEGGLNLVVPPDNQVEDLPSVIRHYRDQVDLVIIGGGDGTLHRALEGLVDTQLPLGILPLGTANDFVRTLKIPVDPVQACDAILQGLPEKVDLGEVNGKLFCNVASVGLAVQVTHQLKQESKSRWGLLAYVFAAMKAICRSRRFQAEIEGIGGRVCVRTMQVTVGNGRSYGGGLKVDESATAKDSLLHLFSIEVDQWWQVIEIVPALWKGRLRSHSKVRTLSGEWFMIDTPKQARPLTADGEFVCHTPGRFRCVPRALEVIMLHSKVE